MLPQTGPGMELLWTWQGKNEKNYKIHTQLYPKQTYNISNVLLTLSS